MVNNKILLRNEKDGINEIKLLFVGDTSFGENYQREIERRGGDNIIKTRGYIHYILTISSRTINPDS
jgi:hypothetical protein